MAKDPVVVIGSGIVGSILAYLLTSQGREVTVFEKGPEYPYPHLPQFKDKLFFNPAAPSYRLPKDIKAHEFTGSYPIDLEGERFMQVGGAGVYWDAITLRMIPNDFRLKSLYGYAVDWPLSYAELEPFYCKAEQLMGVSGTDSDNPYAPRRSRPYPLPPFELSHYDKVLRDRLQKQGLILHTTPQARTRKSYGDRPGCVNYNKCAVCPIGARYSPNYHLLHALRSGRCRLHSNTAVRRIILDNSGKARAVLVQGNDSQKPREYPAASVVVAPGGVEAPRLLLMSGGPGHPDGLGNNGGQVGKHFVMNHIWRGKFFFKEPFYPGRFGGWTGQSMQFRDPEERGQTGGIKIEFSELTFGRMKIKKWLSAEAIAQQRSVLKNMRQIHYHSESQSSPDNFVSLSQKTDRFGDPLAHVHYKSSDLNRNTYQFAARLFERYSAALKPASTDFPRVEQFDSGCHHLGSCRMGSSVDDSVVNSFGQLHEVPNLYVVGGSMFAGTPGVVNPTLTIVALAIRSAEHLIGPS